MFMDEKIITKMLVLLKLIYTYEAIISKFQEELLLELEKIFLDSI